MRISLVLGMSPTRNLPIDQSRQQILSLIVSGTGAETVRRTNDSIQPCAWRTRERIVLLHRRMMVAVRRLML